MDNMLIIYLKTKKTYNVTCGSANIQDGHEQCNQNNVFHFGVHNQRRNEVGNVIKLQCFEDGLRLREEM